MTRKGIEMRVLFAWALGLGLCAGLLAAAEPGSKKPKGGPQVESDPAGVDESAEPDEPAPTGDAPEPDDAAPADDEENEGDEKPVVDKKPVARGAAAKELEIRKKASYMIGADTVRKLQNRGVELLFDEFVQGFKDQLAGKAMEFSDEETKEVWLVMEQIMTERQAEMAKAAGDRFKHEGEAFLAENKKKEGVKTTKSGLQYKVLKSGKGKSPKITDEVSVNYRGTFIDGTEFDNSKNYPKIPAFRLKEGVIKGWTEALQMMKVGDKWRLVIPPALAYKLEGLVDPRSGRQIIPPNATLIFEVELLGIDAGDDE